MGRPQGQSLREWSRRANTPRRGPILHESEILMGRRKRQVRRGAGGGVRGASFPEDNKTKERSALGASWEASIATAISLSPKGEKATSRSNSSDHGVRGSCSQTAAWRAGGTAVSLRSARLSRLTCDWPKRGLFC